MEQVPMSGALGVEMRGVDLSNLSDNMKGAIKDAYNKHCALLFRGQNLAPEAQKEFTQIFGDLVAHPLKTRASVEGHPEVLILENKPGRPGAPNDYWHSDISHMESPPSATVLHSITVPEGYGDTMLCNTARAYENLSDRIKTMIQGLRALHSGEATFKRSLGNSDARKIDPSEVKPPYSHPIVREPEGTGQKSIFVNPHFTIGVEDMDEAEGNWLLSHLYEVSTKPENCYRHRWQEGDVLVWDNRRTMHYAVRDYTEDMPRKMHRCTATGEVPV